MEHIKEKLGALKQESEQLKERNETLQLQLKHAEQRVSEQEDQAVALKNQVALLTSSQEQAQATLTTLKGQLAEHTALQDRLRELEAQVALYKDQAEGLQAKGHQLQQENRALALRVETAEKAQSAAEKSAEEWEPRMAEWKAKHDAVKAELDATVKLLNDL